MGKRRVRSNQEVQPKKMKSRPVLDDSDDEPDPKSREFMYDEVDEFDLDRDKILLDSDDSVDKDEFEDVLPLGDDEEFDDESEDDLDDQYHRVMRMTQKDEIASDIEDEDDDLPDVKAWGKKKKMYYDTDYVDGDYGGNFQGGEEEELAAVEEEEAKKIQKRLLEQINEDDFGLEWIKPASIDKVATEEKVTLDLSKLSKNEKIELLKKEAPEFLELIEDFKILLTEVRERLEPLISFAKKGKLPQVAEYVLLKHELILLYCTNISFYMALKSRGTLSRTHPILKKLAYFKKFLKELKPVDDKLSPYIDTVLEKIRNKETIEEEIQEILTQTEDKPKKKKLRIVRQMEERNAKKTVRFVDETQSNKTQETLDEKHALVMYQMMKTERKTSVEESDSDESGSKNSDDDIKKEDLETDDKNEEFNEKRGITYQIAKNKGLTPHRKKEYRNPRVKHKLKFRKAKIRRKGQVREVRKEIQRYGGEVSGIRIGVKHGRKLK